MPALLATPVRVRANPVRTRVRPKIAPRDNAELAARGEPSLEMYFAPAPDRAWTELGWIPVHRRKPARADGIGVPGSDKIVVWALTHGAHKRGQDPEPCGFDLEHRSFDDDCPGGANEVILWAPMSRDRR